VLVLALRWPDGDASSYNDVRGHVAEKDALDVLLRLARV
jgi:hypothetical protein